MSDRGIQPEGEKIRKAVHWLCEELKLHPEKSRKKILAEAELRFDLSPLECDFINKKLSEEINNNKTG